MAGRAPEVHQKLGYASPAELVLHLPLRYEDETRLTPLSDLRPGEAVLVEGVVAHAEVQHRPRKQLVVQIEAPPHPPSPSGRGAGGEGQARHIPLPPETLEFARQLRRNQTDVEQLVWSVLRDRRLADAKFQRQRPVGPYFLDFYCHERKLAIELDGGQHAEREHDRKRDAFLQAQGVRVLRFWNHDVLQRTEAVLEAIWQALHPPSPLAPLPGGEGRHSIFVPVLFLRFLHYYPSQVTQLKPGAQVRLFGEVRQGYHGLEMVHPRYRLVAPGAPLTAALTPVYPSVASLSQNALRKAVAGVLEEADLSESLPPGLPSRLGLPGFESAVRLLHAPPPDADLHALQARSHPAWRRLKFDELLAQQLALRRHAQARHRLAAASLADRHGLIERLLAALPFRLTGAQRRSLGEILRDLADTHPMNRLLQGDVGSGKTLVAAGACLAAVSAGHQAAVMAPTEILAEQHYLKFREWLAPLGIRVAWFAAAQKGRARREALEAVSSGAAQVAVGTHALFQEGVAFRSLALAVVDEQHRFGVAQRLALRNKGTPPSPNGGEAGVRSPSVGAPSGAKFAAKAAPTPSPEGGEEPPLAPHLLMLSATPIPRSLAMSYLADLDVSVIDELPPGRTPIATRLITMNRRAEVIERLRRYCADGAQAYWVSPLIEESQKLELKAAEDTHAELAAALPELAIGLVHGRMKAEEKAAVMAAFKAGAIQLLVATTVIEVGVDVPNAGLMVIDHAERMGLAQLHQLRGRVGRGTRASSCLLLYAEPLSETARQRLRIIRENQDGFAIAREDLKLRGPGEFLGARQSGVPLLRFADLEIDLDLLEAARAAAAELLARDPEAARRHLARWMPRGEALMLA